MLLPHQGPTFCAALTPLAQAAAASWAPPGVIIDTKAVSRTERVITRHVKELRHHSHTLLPFPPHWSGLRGHRSYREGCRGWGGKTRNSLWVRPRHHLGFYQKFLLPSFDSRKWFDLKPEKAKGSGLMQSTLTRSPYLFLMPNTWKFNHFWYFPKPWDIDGADSVDPGLCIKKFRLKDCKYLACNTYKISGKADIIWFFIVAIF